MENYLFNYNQNLNKYVLKSFFIVGGLQKSVLQVVVLIQQLLMHAYENPVKLKPGRSQSYELKLSAQPDFSIF